MPRRVCIQTKLGTDLKTDPQSPQIYVNFCRQVENFYETLTNDHTWTITYINKNNPKIMEKQNETPK